MDVTDFSPPPLKFLVKPLQEKGLKKEGRGNSISFQHNTLLCICTHSRQFVTLRLFDQHFFCWFVLANRGKPRDVQCKWGRFLAIFFLYILVGGVSGPDPVFCLDPVYRNSWIRIRFVLRGWIRIWIRFVLRGWIRIRSISDGIRNPESLKKSFI